MSICAGFELDPAESRRCSGEPKLPSTIALRPCSGCARESRTAFRRCERKRSRASAVGKLSSKMMASRVSHTT